MIVTTWMLLFTGVLRYYPLDYTNFYDYIDKLETAILYHRNTKIFTEDGIKDVECLHDTMIRDYLDTVNRPDLAHNFVVLCKDGVTDGYLTERDLELFIQLSHEIIPL